MTPERYQQINRILDAALEREPEQRAAFLAEACGGDEELRREAESLLAACVEAGSFIEQPPEQMAAELMTEEAAEPMTGRTLGRYRLGALLGAGGMGQVYRAHDTRLRREVAVKILPEHLANNAEALHRFEREARSVAALSHPNILAIYDFGAEAGVSFAITELLEGETLRARLMRSPINWREVVEIGAAIAEGLAAAHAKGIIHRDLKPENVFLTNDGVIKILDFGIARVKQVVAADSETLASTEMTTPGTVMGTIGYMSPEQVRGEAVEAPSDLFALGCVLYEMASGQRPFARGNAMETMAAILKEEPPSLAELNKDAPAELGRVIGHCLEKKPERRFQSARDLACDLKALLSGRGISLPDLPRARPRVRLAIAIGATVLVVLLAMTAWLYLAWGGKAIDSLAVLPLVNASGDAEMEYLSDGITESIIYRLSQLPQLKTVIAQSTTATYKGKDVDPRKVGQELNVRAVLVGKLIQRGENLTIAAELVNTADGAQLWSGQYRCKLAEIVTVQAEIVQQIAEHLRFTLTSEEQNRLNKRPTNNAEAYQLYLKGRYFLGKYTEDGFKKAIGYFTQAIDQDPGYALAYTGLSDTYYFMSNIYLPPAEAMPKARAAALRALQLDETLGEAHASLAVVKSNYDHDFVAAEQEYKRALDLNPNHAQVHHTWGMVLVYLERSDEARREFRLAQELDPLSFSIASTAAFPFYYARPSERRCDRLIEEMQKILALDSNFPPAHVQLAFAYICKGMHEEAIAAARRFRQLGEDWGNIYPLGIAYAAAGRRDEALKILAELQELTKREQVSAYGPAVIYAQLGEKDRAFALLSEACAQRSEDLLFLKVDPLLDSLRADPRFAKLVLCMGLVP